MQLWSLDWRANDLVVGHMPQSLLFGEPWNVLLCHALVHFIVRKAQLEVLDDVSIDQKQWNAEILTFQGSVMGLD